MTCVICRQGPIQDGTTTVTLQRGRATIVIRDVPAQICQNCGEYYLSEEISARVLELAEQAIGPGTEVQILKFAA